jgi:hypothetical protein
MKLARNALFLVVAATCAAGAACENTGIFADADPVQHPVVANGACVSHELKEHWYWCQDDEKEEYCNAEWAKRVGDLALALSPGKTCKELGYAYTCENGWLLSNASCDASKPAPSASTGGSCIAPSGICSYSTAPSFEVSCYADPANPDSEFHKGETCSDTGVSCLGGHAPNYVAGGTMQVDFYYPASMCSLVWECASSLGGTGIGGC